ncbi:MAG: FG-GAP-like repeat-containing protein, partial [Candidatus Eisenbacteria bacterium]|nr:FG-GAP-like repeat-containing protein [Candidatus Eisenbacteria bacterium]
MTFSLAPSQASGPAALRYGSLAATDARGRSLPAEIDFAESRVRILVDDRDARYPIEIDPLIDVPAWEYRGDQYHLLAGERLSTLGDVNGDGFSDFALGLGRWDGPEGANQGRLFVYYGSPAGPSASPDWSADGQSDSCGFGFTVSTAGDVNADGYDDMIVCAFHERHEDGSRGTVYVYHGSPSGPTGPAWSVRTFAPDTTFTFGYGLALAGDVNGDGYSDVAISDYLHDGTFHRGGAVWVYHGSASGLEDSPAWMTEAENEAAFYGVSLSTAGDIDADGYDDLLVGSTHYHEAGRVYLYRGSASGLSPTPSWTQDGTSYSYYGESVALAGDVNGDGYADVLVADLNSAHLFPGGAAGLGEEIWSRVGENPTTYCGDGLGTAGDVNGDGLADFLVGEPETMTIDGIGKAELFYGNRLEISTEPDWVFVADQPESRMGELVVTAGDVNGDGFSDFLVGEPMYSTEYEYDGRAYLFLGSGEGPRSSPGWVIEPNQVSASFGASIASAGDVNGDGCEDILVGAPGYDLGQVDEGAAFLFLGHGVGPSVVPDWYAEGNQQGAALGSAVAGAGDVDADGYDDVLIGAPDYDYSGIEDSGGAFIWRGTNEGPPPSGNPANANWRGQAAQVDAHYGQSVAWAGDVNGDGYADILIGVPGYSHGEASEGAAVIYHGSASGPPASPDWVAEGGQAGASYGWSVSTAGDANGDMFSDVVVGAPYMDNGLPDEGIAHVFLGHEEGASHVPAWQFEGEEQGGHLGWSVAHAGDVNGDSYSDLLIGMPEFSFAGEHCGLAMCFHGSEVGYAGHIPDEADWKIIGVAGGDRAGYCVAPAGDVDGDGYSDVLVSAPHAAWEGVDDAGLVAWEPGSPDGIQSVSYTHLRAHETALCVSY